jgi:hypothetical protein
MMDVTINIFESAKVIKNKFFFIFASKEKAHLHDYETP